MVKSQLFSMVSRCLGAHNQIAPAALIAVLFGTVCTTDAHNPLREGQTASAPVTSSSFSANQFGEITLGTFTFGSQLFGDTLEESDGGAIYRNNNWLNVADSNPGNPGALTGPNFDTGIANIGLQGLAVIYTIRYDTAIVNGPGTDLGIVSARYSSGDTFRLAVSTDGTNFTAFIDFGPELAVSTGVGMSYFYNHFGPFPANLFVTPVDLSPFGLASAASISAVMITSFPEGDLIRVAGFESFDFDICLEDDSSGSILKFKSTTGDYQFTNCSGLTLSGMGSLVQRGGIITLQHYASDRRVLARIDTSVNKATASIQVFSPSTTFTITDRNTANNTCVCDPQ